MSSTPDPTNESGKKRAQRIPLDYYRKRNAYSVWRRWLSLVAIVTTGLYVAWSVAMPGGQSQLSTGKISAAHSAFENDCQQCHVDFTPIAADAWSLDPHRGAELTAQACKNCHAVDSHHGDRLNEAGTAVDNKCAACHSEHLGADHALVSIADQTCTDCHARLDAFSKAGGASGTKTEIAQFTLASHGEFRSLRGEDAGDPGKVKFNHALHMLPGQVVDGRRGAFQIDRLPASMRARYRKPGQDDDQSAVQLACADCHSFGDSKANGGLNDLAIGQYADAINYENHCAACHQLSILGQSASEPPVPHAVHPSQLKNTIISRLMAFELGDGTGLYGDAVRSTKSVLTPGKNEKIADGGFATSNKAINFRAEQLVNQLGNQCLFCHDENTIEQMSTGESVADSGAKLIPDRWLIAGMFDHRAHTGVSCLVCHPQADPDRRTLDPTLHSALDGWVQSLTDPKFASNAGAGKDHEQIMILGIESCVPCHRESMDSVDAAVETLKPLFGETLSFAPDNCTTCHKYHWNRQVSEIMEMETALRTRPPSAVGELVEAMSLMQRRLPRLGQEN